MTTNVSMETGRDFLHRDATRLDTQMEIDRLTFIAMEKINLSVRQSPVEFSPGINIESSFNPDSVFSKVYTNNFHGLSRNDNIPIRFFAAVSSNEIIDLTHLNAARLFAMIFWISFRTKWSLSLFLVRVLSEF